MRLGQIDRSISWLPFLGDASGQAPFGESLSLWYRVLERQMSGFQPRVSVMTFARLLNQSSRVCRALRGWLCWD